MNFFEKCKQCSIQVGNGSGVLFQPKNANYSYVLTAKHNLKKKKNIQFKYKKVYKHKSLDIAIIKIKKREFISPKIQLTEPKDKEVYKLYGYSSKRRKKNIKIQAFDLTIRDIHNKYENIVFNKDYDAEQEDIDGCSGGGVFKEEKQDFLLAGIECRMDKESKKEENNTRLRFISIKAFDELVDRYSDELVYLDDSKNFNQKYKVNKKVIKIIKDGQKLGEITIKTVPITMEDGRILNVSIYPVTFAEYDLFCKDINKANIFLKGFEKKTVTNINWSEANQYCKWLGKKINKTCKLIDSKDWRFISLNNGIKIEKDIYEWCNDGNESEKKLKFNSQIKLVNSDLKNLKIGFRYNYIKKEI